MIKNQKTLYEELVEISRYNCDTDIDKMMEELYKDNDRFYTFLILVCKHVVFKNKWRKNKINKHYYEFITESDESYAILMLDNTAERYQSMNIYGTNKNNKYLWSRTRYSRMGKIKGELGKGWSVQAKNKYFKIQNAIDNWRDNNGQRMVDIAKFVQKIYISMNGINTKKNNNNIEELEIDELEMEEQCDKSMMQSMMQRKKRKRI